MKFSYSRSKANERPIVKRTGGEVDVLMEKRVILKECHILNSSVTGKLAYTKYEIRVNRP